MMESIGLGDMFRRQFVVDVSLHDLFQDIASDNQALTLEV